MGHSDGSQAGEGGAPVISPREWVREMGRLVGNALPVFAFNISQFANNILSQAFIGRTVGAKELAASALAISYMNVMCQTINFGLATGQETVVSQANGARRYRDVGLCLQRGLLVWFISQVGYIHPSENYAHSGYTGTIMGGEGGITDEEGSSAPAPAPGLSPGVSFRHAAPVHIIRGLIRILRWQCTWVDWQSQSTGHAHVGSVAGGLGIGGAGLPRECRGHGRQRARGPPRKKSRGATAGSPVDPLVVCCCTDES